MGVCFKFIFTVKFILTKELSTFAITSTILHFLQSLHQFLQEVPSSVRTDIPFTCSINYILAKRSRLQLLKYLANYVEQLLISAVNWNTSCSNLLDVWRLIINMLSTFPQHIQQSITGFGSSSWLLKKEHSILSVIELLTNCINVQFSACGVTDNVFICNTSYTHTVVVYCFATSC